MRRARKALAAAAILAAACSDGGPKPGTLVVRLAGAPSVRAVKFRVVGPVDAVAPPADTVAIVSAAAGSDTLVIAAFADTGDSLNGWIVARIDVPDVNASGAYVATALEVARPSYALQTPSQYTLIVVRP